MARLVLVCLALALATLAAAAVARAATALGRAARPGGYGPDARHAGPQAAADGTARRTPVQKLSFFLLLALILYAALGAGGG